MLALQTLRAEPDLVRASLQRRRSDADIDAILALDVRHRDLLTRVEEMRATRNATSKQIGQQKEKSAELVAAMRQLGDEIKTLETELDEVSSALDSALLELPNLVDPRVPDGPDESANLVVRVEGTPVTFPDGFTPQPHWEIGERLGIIDFERGVKITGSRFYVMKGAAARLQRALIQFMLDLHADQHGCTEVYPPFLVKEETVLGAGQLPKFRDNLYRDHEDDLWLVPTAEVPVTNLYRDEVLDASSLPLRYVAYTPCFRREKMSAGRDVRGIKRGHQFDKVELYTFCLPEESEAEHQRILASAEAVCQALGFHYRVVELCSGDTGFAAMRTFDLEVWAAGSESWLEVSSCSNVGDFQARRANVRFRREPGARPEFPHTLNGSGLALPRVVIAILENGQQPDGSIIIPEPLVRYTGFSRIPAA